MNLGGFTANYILRTGIAAVVFILLLKAAAGRVPALQGVAGRI